MDKQSDAQPSEFSDSDRAQLDALLQERKIDAEIARRRRATIDAIKGWATWISAIGAAWLMLWDKFWPPLKSWARGLFT